MIFLFEKSQLVSNYHLHPYLNNCLRVLIFGGNIASPRNFQNPISKFTGNAGRKANFTNNP